MKSTVKQKSPRRAKIEVVIKIICYTIVVINIFIILYTFRYDLLLEYYSDYSPKAINLTEEQKVEDFDYFCDTLLSSYPMLGEYEKIYGCDFETKRAYYENLVKGTSSDYEFFCVMCSIAGEFQSFHTNFSYPRFSLYKGLGCYNMTPTLVNNKVYPASIDWEALLTEEYEKEKSVKATYVPYIYIDGEYVLTDDVEGHVEGNKLKEINGQDIHVFIQENTFSMVEKKYDRYLEKIYVGVLWVNDKRGEAVVLTLEDAEGNTYTQNAFCETSNSMGISLLQIYGDTSSKSSVCNLPIYDYVDEEQGIGYIRIGAFSGMWEEEMIAALKRMQNCENVILDIRNNSGGIPEVAQESVYPYLFAEDVIMDTKWYMIDSPQNRQAIIENIPSLMFKGAYRKVEGNVISSEAGQQYLCTNRYYEYKGNLEEEKKIYVLVNSGTGSAADGFTAALKKTSAVIIGEPTAGEGLADSYICDYLPNSGLVFAYMYGRAYNEDGTDNSMYGTAPDVFARISIEGYDKADELSGAGQDLYTYENLLLWDDVVIKAVEMINAK